MSVGGDTRELHTPPRRQRTGCIGDRRKLIPGCTEHSFGIHVAKMAGMPRWVVDRAEQMLHSMEAANRDSGSNRPETDGGKGRKPKKSESGEHTADGTQNSKADAVLDMMKRSARKTKAPDPAQAPGMQLSMFQLDDPVLKQIRDEIKGLDIYGLTPLEALNKLNEIKKITGL